jgi:hypothetical protein
MTEHLFFLIFAILMIILFPLIPRMVEFSITVLKVLKWNGLAELYRNNFGQLVAIVRIMLAIIIICMLFLVFMN